MLHNYSNVGTNETRLSIRDWNHLNLEGKTNKLNQLFFISGRRYGPLDAIFVVSCIVGFFIDPFFFYIWNINDDIKCLSADSKLRISFLVLRSVVDFFYIAAFMRNYCGTRSFGHTSRVIKLSRFTLSVGLAMPFPDVGLLTKFSILSSLKLVFLGQYILRISNIYGWIKLIDIETRIGKLVEGVLDLSPFFLTAHFTGAMWHILAIERETRCWRKVCRNVDYDLFCTGPSEFRKNNTNIINKLCLTNPSNASVLDFGIYLNAVKFGTTRTTSYGSKLLQCFWWGLRNLSSLGSNLEPSAHAWENLFAICISMSGIILFLIYLNGNMQIYKICFLVVTPHSFINMLEAWNPFLRLLIGKVYTYRQLAKKVSTKLKFNRKMQKISPDIDLWLSKNADVPKDMKTVIMETVRYRVEEDKDFHVENIVSVLSPVHRRLIMRHLCLDLLKKVPLLEDMDDQVLKAISEHLNWVFYAVDSYIIREGEPLAKMFFIRQGTALTCTTRTDQTSGGSTSGSSITDNLEKDNLYGAELLEWAFSFGSFSNLPVSTRTVVSQERVEAFVIRAKDLKKIVSMFRWHFSRRLQLNDIEDSLLRQLKFLAISTLLGHRKAMARRGTGWDQVYNKLIKSD